MEALEPGHWPPKSPYEALLSSPNGRQKLRSRATSRQVSTSPLKKSSAMPNLRLERSQSNELLGEEEDEDEETLQLQLAAIEAKLKLKKLQNKKAAPHGPHSTNDFLQQQPDSARAGSLPSPIAALQDSRNLSTTRAKPMAALQVPVSPTNPRAPSNNSPQQSPSRVRLGIDKGLNGREVSLRRPPTHRAQENPPSNPFVDTGKARNTSRPSVPKNAARDDQSTGGLRSFATRMAEAREKEQTKQFQRDRLLKMRDARTKAFAVDQDELGILKGIASEQAETEAVQKPGQSNRTYSREEVLMGSENARQSTSQKSTIKSLPASAVAQSKVSEPRPSRHHSPINSQRPQNDQKLSEESTPSAHSEGCAPPVNTAAATFESYSCCNLSRRVLPHSFVERTVEGKTTVVIPDLLKSIKGPDYLVPDEYVEDDYVLFALIASKSAPIDHKQPAASEGKNGLMTSEREAQQSLRNENGKYLVITLTDLKWTLDLFLFGPAFVRFRKLTPGTLIAVLNPEIMPPPRHLANTGKWSLKLTSAEETVLEIGTSKDLGWCKSIRKDGQLCGAWVDHRHTEYCEFHTNLGVEKIRSGRMEVQGMSALFGPGGKNSRYGSKNNSFGAGGRQTAHNGVKPRAHRAEAGGGFDRETRSTYFVASGGGPSNHSAASLLDADDFMIRGGSQARQRELLAAREKENNIAASLGLRGDGAGADYLRMRNTERAVPMEQANPSNIVRPSRDAKSLGLTSNKSSGILLSPLKRKRSGRGDEMLASTKKKTRFVTPKGIREAGRDSLNVYESKGSAIDEDEELDIV